MIELATVQTKAIMVGMKVPQSFLERGQFQALSGSSGLSHSVGSCCCSFVSSGFCVVLDRDEESCSRPASFSMSPTLVFEVVEVASCSAIVD